MYPLLLSKYDHLGPSSKYENNDHPTTYTVTICGQREQKKKNFTRQSRQDSLELIKSFGELNVRVFESFSGIVKLLVFPQTTRTKFFVLKISRK